MPKLEPLQLQLTGSADGLSSALGKAEGRVKGFSGVVGGIGDKLGGLIAKANPVGIAISAAMAVATAAATATAMAVAKVRQAMTDIDDLNDSANRLGVTFSELQGLRLSLGEATGADTSAIDAAIVKLQVNLGEAAQTGAGKVFDALQEVGLNAGDLLAMGPQKAIEAIAAEVSKVGDSGKQTKLIFDLLGKSGVAIAAALRESPGGLREAAEWAQKNLALSEQQVEQVGAANDAWARIGLKIENVFQVIAAELAPVIETIADDVLDWSGGFEGMVEMARSFADLIASTYAVLKDMVELYSATSPIAQSYRLLTGDLDGAAEAVRKGFSIDAFDTLAAVDKNRADAASKSSKSGISEAQAELADLSAAAGEAVSKTTAGIDAGVKRAADLIRQRSQVIETLNVAPGPLSATTDRAAQIRRIAEIQGRAKASEDVQKQELEISKGILAEQRKVADLIQRLIDQGNDTQVLNLT